MEWLLILSLCLVGFFVCGCPCKCLGCSDIFSGFTPGTNIDQGCGYIEVVGDFEIIDGGFGGANLFQITSSNAVAICDTVLASAAMRATIGINGNTTADEFRVIFDYLDVNNYHFAQFVLGAGGHVKLFKRTIGVNAELATAAANFSTGGLYKSLSACFNQDLDRVVAVANQPAGNLTVGIAAVSTAFGGTQGGLGTGTVTGSPNFVDFGVGEVRPVCSQCGGVPCANCEDGTTVNKFKVIVSGLSNQTCMGCAAQNATYYPDRGTSSGEDCTYTVGVSSACTDFNSMNLAILANNVVEVYFSTTVPGTKTMRWLDATGTGLVDCDEQVDRSVPFDSDNTAQCASSGAACLVTSI